MTEAEVEAAVNRLNGHLMRLHGQVAELERQQARRQKHWLRWGLVFACSVVALSTFSLISGMKLVISESMPLLCILALACQVPQPPQVASMSVMDRVKWLFGREQPAA
jgi:hypothetical protein